MLQDDVKIFDVDAHLLEPPTVWTDRMPAKYKEAAPHIVEREGHALSWIFEGKNKGFGMVGSATTQIFRTDGRGEDFVARHYDDLLPAAHDPKARLEALDADGIWAQLNFPSFPRFAGTLFLEAEDKDLALLCVQAYNDWHIDEWCAAAPGRLIPMVILPLWDPVAAAAEVYRTAERGAKAVTFPEHTVALGLPSFWTDNWDPVWAAVQDVDVPLCTHVGTQGSLLTPSPESNQHVVYSLANVIGPMASATDLIFSGVFERFPGLKFIISEAGAGWVPYLAERMDYEWTRVRSEGIAEAPSAVLARHFWMPIVEDYVAIELRHRIGVNRILFETDFPHQDGNYPNSRKLIADMLVDVPDDEAKQMAELNARELLKV